MSGRFSQIEERAIKSLIERVQVRAMGGRGEEGLVMKREIAMGDVQINMHCVTANTLIFTALPCVISHHTWGKRPKSLQGNVEGNS